MAKKEFIAYAGSKHIIEWYFDDDGNSQSLEYFMELDRESQKKLLYLFKRMGDFGEIADKTKFRTEGAPIYGFKPNRDRFLCFFQKGRKLIVTNAFFKKGQKLPKAERDRAVRCMDDYLERVEQGGYYDE